MSRRRRAPRPRRRHGASRRGRGLRDPVGRGHRRARLQHRDERLPGGPDRPELRGPGRRLHVPAYRQLRRHPPRRGVAPARAAGASSSATSARTPRAGAPRGPLEGFLVQHRIAGDHRRRHAPTHPPASASPGPWAARSGPRRSSARRRGARRGRPPTDRTSRRRSAVTWPTSPATGRCASWRSTTASSRRSSASSPRASRSTVVPATTSAAAIRALEPARGLPLERPRRPLRARRPARHGRRPAR